MSAPVTAVIVGAGHRGVGYATLALHKPDMLQIVGVADPDELQPMKHAEKFGVPEENLY